MRRHLLVSLLAVLVLVAVPAAAAAKTKTFSSGPVNMPIQDAVGNPPFGVFVTNSFNVKKRGRIKDVNVSVRITHPDATDLVLEVTHRGFGALLADHRPKDGNALSPDYGAGAPACDGAALTTFDDSAPLSIASGTSPFAGTFQPEPDGVPLSELNGLKLQGKWQLDLLDGLTPGRAGTLNCWEITVRYKPEKRKD